jgi:lysozyme family protein
MAGSNGKRKGRKMANFRKAIKVLLDHEGGFSNHPNDPGGATNHGISLRYLRTLGELGDIDLDGDVDIDDIQLLTIEKSSFIYQREWWNRFRYNLINDDEIATKMLDWAVNVGFVPTHKIVQRALNLLPAEKGQEKEYLKVDGILGKKTMAALNAADPKRLMILLRGVLASYYVSLAEGNQRFEDFIVGWLNAKAFDEKFPLT